MGPLADGGGLVVRPLECGWLTAEAGGMLAGATGTMHIPVGAFLVEHPAGTRLVYSHDAEQWAGLGPTL